MYQSDLKVNGCAASRADLTRIKDALSFIDSDLPRDEWWKILAAIKSELGEGGRDLALQWSRGGDSFDLAGFDDTWRSVKPGVGIGIGTLFYMAKEAGWTDSSPRPKLTAEQVEARRKAKEAEAKKADAKARAEQARAAEQAVSIWEKAHPADPAHPYLVRKQVAPTATLRQIDANDLSRILGYQPKSDGEPLAGTVLVVPARRAGSDALSTLEFIDAHGRKTALPGQGTKSRSCWTTIYPLPADVEELLIGEGTATCMSAAEVTGLPAVAALSCSNLKAVVEDFRGLYPGTKITVLADLDKKTSKPIPNAVEAARAVNGFLAVPGFGPDRLEGQTDFNDLHVMAGLEAVRTCVAAARQVVEESAPLPHGYSMTDKGLFWTQDEEGKNGPVTLRLSPPLQVLDLARDEESQGWGLRLKWKDPDEVEHEHILAYSSLAASKAVWVEELAALGWLAESEKPARAALTRFFTTIKPQTRARTASTTGWSADQQAFVLPDVTLGADSGEKIVLRNRPRQNPYLTKGTLEGWQNTVGRWAGGNDFLIFAISLALAAPLAKILGAESGGFHFYNDSTSAKTTTLQVANSVWCSPYGFRQWRGTDNGLEGICSLYTDTLLCLDEIGQASSKIVGEVAYLIANEKSKIRMERQCTAREVKSWKILFLSSGEKTVADKIKEDGGKIKSGQEVRIVDIFCDAGAGMGAFQRLHEHQNPRDFAEVLKSAASQNYGHLGREWVQFLIDNKDFDEWGKRYRQIRDELVEILKVQNGQCLRVMNRFALVAVAGELAIEAGLVQWNHEDAINASGALAKKWLEARGGDGSGEDRRAVEAVLGFISKYSLSKFQNLDIAADLTEKIIERAGYKKKGLTGKIQYIFTRGQLAALLGDIPFKQAVQALASKGLLLTEDRHCTKKVKLPDGHRERCYVVEIPDQADTED